MASANESCSNTNNSSSTNKLYRGVRKRKWGKWVSEIRLPNSRERIWLGSYDTQEKAARAFDAALYCLRGSNASFNFPDTPLNMEINNIAAVNVSRGISPAAIGCEDTLSSIPDQKYNIVAVNVPRDQLSLSPQEIQEVAAKFANDITSSTLETHEEEEPISESRGGCEDSFGNNVLVDHGEMRTTDWTFLNTLDNDDYNNGVNAGSHFGLYSGLEKMYSGELLYYTQPPPLFEDNIGDEFIEGDDDAFSNHSILWSWNF